MKLATLKPTYVGPQNCAQYVCFNLLSFYFNLKFQASELVLSVQVRS